jgi:formylglycine-generating enzyme required for sulfatase activity
MKIVNAVVVLSAAGLLSIAQAGAVVSDVKVAQDPGTCQVAVDYTLSERAIVTVDFLTNGVSVGGARFRSVAGDVHKVVEAGARRILWRPDKDWPNVRLGKDVVFTAKVTAWAENTPPNYMVIRIDDAVQELPAEQRTTYYETAEALPFPGGVQDVLCLTDYLVFRKCPAANVTFRIGAITADCNLIECRPAHFVTLTNDFYIGVYEVTQQQYAYFAGTKQTAKPSYFTADWAMRPVENVSMVALRGYCNYDPNCTPENGKRKYWPESGHEILATETDGSQPSLSRLRLLTGKDFDLPTDAQHEFAARAGKPGVLPDGYALWDTVDGLNSQQRVGKYTRSQESPDITVMPSAVTPETPAAAGGTAVVGSYAPNDWGIYDMVGNVSEWCLDNWAVYASDDPEIDPVGPATPLDSDSSKIRLFRGGNWKENYGSCLIPRRWRDNALSGYSGVGFRLCLTLP